MALFLRVGHEEDYRRTSCTSAEEGREAGKTHSRRRTGVHVVRRGPCASQGTGKCSVRSWTTPNKDLDGGRLAAGRTFADSKLYFVFGLLLALFENPAFHRYIRQCCTIRNVCMNCISDRVGSSSFLLRYHLPRILFIDKCFV